MPYVTKPMPQCSIVDTNAKLTAAIVAPLTAAGYAGVARYVPLPNNNAGSDIDAVELSALVEGGLGVILVQHVRLPGWNPAQCSGAADAATAIKYAKAAGYLAQGHIFLDLEGIGGTAAATLQYANDWANAVAAANYQAGCYVGFDVPLSAQQLYEDLKNINSYWSAEGDYSVAVRGFAIRQHATVEVQGIGRRPGLC